MTYVNITSCGAITRTEPSLSTHGQLVCNYDTHGLSDTFACLLEEGTS